MTKVIKIALASSLLVAGLSANDVIKGSGASFPYSVYQNGSKHTIKRQELKSTISKKVLQKGSKI